MGSFADMRCAHATYGLSSTQPMHTLNIAYSYRTGEFARTRSTTHAPVYSSMFHVWFLFVAFLLCLNNSFQVSAGQVGICASLGIHFPAVLLVFPICIWLQYSAGGVAAAAFLFRLWVPHPCAEGFLRQLHRLQTRSLSFLIHTVTNPTYFPHLPTKGTPQIL